jgi:alanyl-tRNA synthetase
MGDTGPCGPCSEILWDFGGGKVKKEDFETDRFMEIWNLVFMQFNRDSSGKMNPLAKPSIDTGMGLERLAAVVQGVTSSWETDLFVPLIEKIEKVTGVKRGSSEQNDVALRVIADHIRGSVFLVADGVTPSNEGRGYVLRRIMRRAIRYGKMLGMDHPFFAQIAHAVVDQMGPAYPELVQHQKFAEKVIAVEEERFYEALGKGLALLDEEFGLLKKAKKKVLPGAVAFRLYDTYGFPKDLTDIIAGEQGFTVDDKGFEDEMNQQRERGRSAWKGSGEEAVAEVWMAIQKKTPSQFVGYTEESAEAMVTAVVKDGKLVDAAQAGDQVMFTTNVTPFYGESGGQVGDIGMAVGNGIEVEVADTKKPLPDLIVHVGTVKKGTLKADAKLTMAIDSERRADIRRNHTATHLLHKAMREVLGEHVKQAGSLVAPDRLRFDFSHFQAVTKDELKQIEANANKAVRENFEVAPCEMSYDDAVAQGALAFFGEKYGDEVRMVDVSGFSRELCGGTHVSATGEIGLIKITGESSVAAGVRRIEAVTGRGAIQYVERLEGERNELAKFLKVQPSELTLRVHRLAEEVKKLEQKMKSARTEQAGASVDDLVAKAADVGGVKLIAERVDGIDQGTMRDLGDKVRDKLQSGVIVLGAEVGGKTALIVMVTKDLTNKIRAGDIMKALATIVGGKGGGRPDMAQGGGPDVSKLDEALNKVKEMMQ